MLHNVNEANALYLEKKKKKRIAGNSLTKYEQYL